MGSEDEKKMSSFSRWMVLFKERAPIGLFAFLALGPMFSAQYLTSGGIASYVRLFVGTLAFMVVLLLVRVMDDVKDYDTDVEVHPDRPLPRGLLTVAEVVDVIKMTTAGLFAFAFLLSMVYGTSVGVAFGAVMLYVVAMYFEFGIGEWLDERPLLYGLSHQFCVFLAAVFACLISGDSAAVWKSQTYFFGAVGLSGFFAYEVCRKLDPKLPKKKGTYLVHYGRWNTFAIMVGTVGMGVIAGLMERQHRVLLPMQLVLLASLYVLFAFFPESRKFKVVEGIAVLYFLVHVWSVPLNHWLF